MKIYDAHHRVIYEISWRRIQLRTFVIEPTDGSINGIIIGFDKQAIEGQNKTEQCSKCERWVPVACEVPNDPERCMQVNGPWDFVCDGYYHPWKYE